MPVAWVHAKPVRTPITTLDALAREIVACCRCPRLVAWREQVAATKRRAYAGETYWARPLPGFGDPDAKVVLVGLAPAAHGGNRTGRIFTGDRSGDFLVAALHRAGFANQPRGIRPGDGLELADAWLTAVVRCAPPQNRPTRQERDACLSFLRRELELLPSARVFVALGAFAHDGLCDALGLRPRPRFAHGATHVLADGRVLVDSFHPSQQNTFTGRLTDAMLDHVLATARRHAGLLAPPARSRG
jgi:uracil-DNA glycosylase family 4